MSVLKRNFNHKIIHNARKNALQFQQFQIQFKFVILLMNSYVHMKLPRSSRNLMHAYNHVQRLRTRRSVNRGLGLEKFVLLFDPTEHTTPARVQAKSHGKTRAGVVCFRLEPKRRFSNPWPLLRCKMN